MAAGLCARMDVIRARWSGSKWKLTMNIEPRLPVKGNSPRPVFTAVRACTHAGRRWRVAPRATAELAPWLRVLLPP